LLTTFIPGLCAQEFTEATEDNSFLIEEGDNQEVRVVQHIFNGYYLSDTRDMFYTFTQEWPMGGTDSSNQLHNRLSESEWKLQRLWRCLDQLSIPTVTSTAGNLSVFAYLSVEHPF